MKTIVSWFQGQGYHMGARKTAGYYGPGLPLCLVLACEDHDEERRLAQIVGELFPERVCDCPLITFLVHFNNDPKTTRDQIDKIMHEYRMRYGE